MRAAGLPAAACNDSVRRIQQALAANSRGGRHAVLVVDEAHLLHDVQTLEALRLLLNFQADGQPGLTVLLVGQPGVLPLLVTACRNGKSGWR